MSLLLLAGALGCTAAEPPHAGPCTKIGGGVVCAQDDDPMPSDPSGAHVPSVVGGPDHADLDAPFVTIGEQGECNTCVAFAARTAIQILGGGGEPPSAAHVWFLAGLRGDSCARGSRLTDAISNVALSGVWIAGESAWPYPVGDVDSIVRGLNTAPGSLDGLVRLDATYVVDSNSASAVRSALASSWPVLLSLPVYYQDAARTEPALGWQSGYIDVDDQSAHPPRHHVVTVTGYDDELRVFRFVNSWGLAWPAAGGGRGTVSYAFVDRFSSGGMAIRKVCKKGEPCDI